MLPDGIRCITGVIPLGFVLIIHFVWNEQMLPDGTRCITGVIPLGFVVIHTFCME